MLPVAFRWRDMDAGLLKLLMRIGDDDDSSLPLYMANVLCLLRRFQREARQHMHDR